MSSLNRRETPDALASRIEAALADADARVIADTDQLAGMWRDFFASRGLDIRDECTADASLRTLTMVYGFLMVRHANGRISDACWQQVNDVIAESATAVTTLRGNVVELPPLD